MLKMQAGQETQELPVNLYDDGHELVVVVPMPGLTPDEIEVEVGDHELSIQGQLRGPRQDERSYLLHEWRYGPFTRRLDLPFAVDATKANATHGNGILTVALPKSDQPRPGVIRLYKGAGSHHDQEQRHAGREAEPRP
jgi:HSP20 family protein